MHLIISMFIGLAAATAFQLVAPTEATAQGVCSIGCSCIDDGCGCSRSGGRWGSCETDGSSCAVTDCGGALVHQDALPSPDGRLFIVATSSPFVTSDVATAPALPSTRSLIEYRCPAVAIARHAGAHAADEISEALAILEI